jgi:hypothetical protein
VVLEATYGAAIAETGAITCAESFSLVAALSGRVRVRSSDHVAPA